MKLLMMDTSGPVCGLALMIDGEIVYEATLKNSLTHSQKIMPMLDTMLSMMDLQIEDVDCFGAVTGPGSFTGVRIGVSTAKGLAQAGGKPCVGVDALEALAANVCFSDERYSGIVCPILDARAQQVYGAIFQSGSNLERLREDEAMKLTEFATEVRKLNEPALFLGDGVMPLHDLIISELGELARFAPAQHNYLRAGSACKVAMERIEKGLPLLDADTLLPTYLRAPQAERERAQREMKGES